MGIDLDAFAARLHAAREESGTWALQEEDGGVWIDALGDGPAPGDAACRFLREIREDTEDLVAELRADREWAKVAATALEACRDPWYSAPDHGDPTCPDPSCPACWRQEEEARELARIALNAYDQATGRPDPAAGHTEPEGPPYPYETRESPAFTAWVERRAVDLCTGAENGHDDAECRPCFAHLKAARWEGFGAWGLGP